MSATRAGLSINLVRGGSGGAPNCIRMAPPLTISDDEIDQAAEIMDASLDRSGVREIDSMMTFWSFRRRLIGDSGRRNGRPRNPSRRAGRG